MCISPLPTLQIYLSQPSVTVFGDRAFREVSLNVVIRVGLIGLVALLEKEEVFFSLSACAQRNHVSTQRDGGHLGT